MMKYPKVSIIIPVKKNNENLRECVAYCRRLDYPDYEIIVLPDEKEGEEYTGVRVIPTGPIGPAQKRDLGMEHASAAILAFLDDDTFPSEGWLKEGVKHFLQDENIAAVGGPAVTPSGDNLLQQASGLVYSSPLASGSNTYRYLPRSTRVVEDYPSCNFLARKAIMEEIGGFGSEFWPGEDTKLCLRIVKDLGKMIIYDPKVLIYHHRRPLYRKHLQQVASYALHRGYFAKRFPETSRKISYFLPSLFVMGLFFGWLLGFVHPFFFRLYLGIILVYFICVVSIGLRHKRPKLAFLVSSGIFATNFFYGIFFLKGLVARKLKEE
jgi:GT2 family glycosyltransferase